jgi:hypothetical protein
VLEPCAVAHADAMGLGHDGQELGDTSSRGWGVTSETRGISAV